MFPSYGYNCPYPQGRAHMSADCHHHPISEGLPPQMKMESSSSPFMYEAWPHHYGYPAPTQYHSCCNHNPYPSYYPYRPPHPQFPSPPHPQHCYGGYPVYPEPYPFHYAPPPHYTMELPKYEYDKSMPRDYHCCGCHPHHKLDMKEDKRVKIEEQEPEVESKEDSLVPAGPSSLRHPVVWMSPDYMTNQERPSVSKPHQAFQSPLQGPNVWKGWPPLDYESIKKILEGGDGRRSQDQQNKHWVNPKEGKVADHQEGPSVMVPQQDIKRILGGSDGRGSQDQQDKRFADHQEAPSVMMPQQGSKNAGQEPTSGSGWVPLDIESLKKLLQNGNLQREDNGDQPKNPSHQVPFPMIWLPYNKEEKGPTKNERDPSTSAESPKQLPCKSEQGHDHTQKSIPTVGDNSIEGGKTLMGRSDKPVKIIPVKQMDEPAIVKPNNELKTKNVEDNKKSTENGTKSKLSSPTKVSKLPPICLRVDPPKKKNGQVKSTSPSPYGNKVQQFDVVKPSSSIPESKAKAIQNEAEKKTTEVPHRNTETANIEAEKQSKLGGEDNQSIGGKEIGQPPKSQEVAEKKVKETQKPEKKIMSGAEAATVIQSAYRGYELRRWEPLKKMRQIANIREDAEAVKRCIESSAGSMDIKQKTALGESIMNLLLKLDTLQGLHSSIRDSRKSVAKELVSLQEKLDTIMVKQPDHSPQITKAVEPTLQTPVESARTMEANTKDGFADESTQSSGPSKIEDRCAGETDENTNDQISSSNELSVEEEITTDIAEEAGRPLSDSQSQQNEFDLRKETAVEDLAEKYSSVEEPLIESIGLEPSPEASDQAEMEHDLLTELPVAVLENDLPETAVCSKAEKSQQVNLESEDSNPPVTEPNKQEQVESEEGLERFLEAEDRAQAAIFENRRDNEADSSHNDKEDAKSAFEPETDHHMDAKSAEHMDSNTTREQEADQGKDAKSAEHAISNPDFEPETSHENVAKSAEQVESNSSVQPEIDQENDAKSADNNSLVEPETVQENDAKSAEQVESNASIENDAKSADGYPLVEPETVHDPNAKSAEQVESNASIETDAKSAEELSAEQVESNASIGNDAKSADGNPLVEPVAEPETVHDPNAKSAEELPAEQVESNASIENDAKSADSNPLVEPETVHDTNAKSAEEDARLAIPATENTVKEEEGEKTIMEENEKMRKLLEKLIESGKEQQQVICTLNEKLKDLEGKLAKQKTKKKKTTRSRKTKVQMPRVCRSSDGFSKESPMTLTSS